MSELSLEEYRCLIDLIETGVWNGMAEHGSDKEKLRGHSQSAFDDAVENRLISLLGEYEYLKSNKERFPDNRIHSGGWFIPHTDKDNPASKDGCFLLFSQQKKEEAEFYLSTIKTFYGGRVFVLENEGSPEIRPYETDEIADLFTCCEFEYGNFRPCSLTDIFKGHSEKKKYVRGHLSSTERTYLEQQYERFKRFRAEVLDTFLERLVIDQFMFQKYRRGTISDIDFVLWVGDKPYYIDVKRKYPDEKGCYGINARHLPFFISLENQTAGESVYIVVKYDRRTGKTTDIKQTPMRNFLDSHYETTGAGGLHLDKLKTKGVPDHCMKSVYR